ncbi:Ig-like domain-containing protein [Terrisporobacter petrolearius]|uniref:Ig-like domain-containing protein n=1 Tax=Terrisporobacter petrolearius TaxID=1460447 RepID=UPI003B00E0B3
MKKIFKSLTLSIVIAFSMTFAPSLSILNNENISVVEAATKKTFKTFTVNSVYNSSTKIRGKGTKGATVRAYVGGKQVGKTKVSSSGTYSIKISKKKKNTKITIKISKNGYTTKSKAITVKGSSYSSSSNSYSSKYVYANGGKSTSKIYHKTAKAHNMEGAIKMTKSKAMSKGYRACKRCWR